MLTFSGLQIRGFGRMPIADPSGVTLFSLSAEHRPSLISSSSRSSFIINSEWIRSSIAVKHESQVAQTERTNFILRRPLYPLSDQSNTKTKFPVKSHKTEFACSCWRLETRHFEVRLVTFCRQTWNSTAILNLSHQYCFTVYN